MQVVGGNKLAYARMQGREAASIDWREGDAQIFEQSLLTQLAMHSLGFRPSLTKKQTKANTTRCSGSQSLQKQGPAIPVAGCVHLLEVEDVWDKTASAQTFFIAKGPRLASVHLMAARCLHEWPAPGGRILVVHGLKWSISPDSAATQSFQN